jgi:hypothetical protein
MAAELLALAAGADSAGRILTATDRRNVEFLDVLIENEQKEVIAHTVVQRYLQVRAVLFNTDDGHAASCPCFFEVGRKHKKLVSVTYWICKLVVHLFHSKLQLLKGTMDSCHVRHHIELKQHLIELNRKKGKKGQKFF